MDDVAIQATNLSKVYKLYARPHYRFLDLIGLLGWKRNAFSERAALANVNLSIRRGEKVAVIGRNGAGKSTLLKMVTGAIQPSSGTIVVRGETKALLQIGTGFHPDFSGRDNVLAYLSCLGITGREANRMLLDVIAFAELEEYVDQPFKTYSTGMGARLMFSVATVISPEILVLDEILGVGDAYFAHKCLDRMKKLCDNSGTTVLLVSHDVYSASRICERMIWLERGQIVMDASSPEVIKAYEDSIRVQEELRLQLYKRERLKALENELAKNDSQSIVFEIRSLENKILLSPVYFSKINLLYNDILVASLPLQNENIGSELASHLQQDGSSWGEYCRWQGRDARPMLNYGSPFRKVGGVLCASCTLNHEHLRLQIDHWSEEACELQPVLLIDDREIQYEPLTFVPRQWNSCTLSPCTSAQPQRIQMPTANVHKDGIHGSGDIVVSNVLLVDQNEVECFFIKHRATLTVLLDYVINRPDFCEAPQIVLAFHKDGVSDVCRIRLDDVFLDAAKARSGRIRVTVPSFCLTDGQYTMTVLLAKPGYYDEQQVVFYTISPNVYFCASRILQLVVTDSGSIGSGTISICDASAEQLDEHLLLDFPSCLKKEFPSVYSYAIQATEQVIEATRGTSFNCLFSHFPSWTNADVVSYLRCCLARVVRVGERLKASVKLGSRILDYGSFLGNFSLMIQKMGYDVDAADSYESYQESLKNVVSLLEAEGVHALDCDLLGHDLLSVASETYDVVLCMSVSEHVPHTPRPLMEALNRLLKPGGLLILDTPNHAYAYNREKLTRGECVHDPLVQKYCARIPFSGHHRKYTVKELQWMLEQIGHREISIDTFCCSIYQNSYLKGRDAMTYKRMMEVPDCREMIIATSQKPIRNAA